jgi:DNA-directed RNA polymerase III subunit RPC1
MAELLPIVRKRLMDADDGAGDHTISHIQFGMFGPGEVAKVAEFEVINDKAYEMPEAGQERGRQPVLRGVLDRRLGVSDKAATCDTCGLRMQDCPGHFGYVKLELPVFHIGYLKPMLAVLQCICKTCSRVLLKQEDRTRYLRSLSHPLTKGDTIRTASTFKRIVDACKKVRDCPHCASRNGNVKKVGFARVIHERTAPKDNSERARGERAELAASLEMVFTAGKGSFESGQLAGADVKELLPKAAEDLNPLRVRELLRAIPPADLPLLDMSAVHGR